MEIDPQKVRHFLSLRAISRDTLVARTGISYREITYYLSGTRRPRVRNFRKLYTALGCAPEDLLKRGYKKQHIIDQNAPSIDG